ncbi:hypothetical protein F8388_010476 [Cannabis sativa]|uniref:3-hydroxyisobutyryl-CoA hydrolase n=1 Tax=Cannabis sativa TaxID=3483 RepID=A0A7J6GU76_CANSA|nr:hypothetical protein F8388_010476 [Cannabis sativa]
MAQEVGKPNEEEVVLGEEIDHVRLITLNRPRQLNVISSRVVSLLAEYLEKWEKDDKVELILIKGAGRAFSAGGDLKMFYDGRTEKDSCLEVVYRMYWLCYHIHTYKKTQVALAHGISMGGGASLMVPLKFSVVTEKTVGTYSSLSFPLQKQVLGFILIVAFPTYILVPGNLGKHTITVVEHAGEYLALTGARLNGKELVAIGLATHFVPSEKIPELEKRLISLNSGKADAVKSAIEEFSVEVKLDDESVLNNKGNLLLMNVFQRILWLRSYNHCKLFPFCVTDEVESKKEGNGWIGPVLKGLKRSSPTGLNVTLKSIREGRKQSLSECLKKEFRVTINILRATISNDVYEGIRALTIDKDNSPKWSPPSLDKVDEGKVDLIFQQFEEKLELQIPETEECRWDGKYENSTYGLCKTTK